MHIVCACLNSIDVEISDFGISYVTCKCGREYEINSEFELAVDIEEE